MRYGLSVHSSEKSSQPAPFPNIHHHLKTVIHHSVMIANPLKWIFFSFFLALKNSAVKKSGAKPGSARRHRFRMAGKKGAIHHGADDCRVSSFTKF